MEGNSPTANPNAHEESVSESVLCGGDTSILTSELPFLVTHWLANYKATTCNSEDDRRRDDAIQRIHCAASEIASAFSVLGAYGTTYMVSYSFLTLVCHRVLCTSTDTLADSKIYVLLQPNLQSRLSAQDARNATYSDMARRYPQVAPSHLESVVQSSASSALAIQSVSRRESGNGNIFLAAHEMKPNLGGGRRLGDEIDLTGDNGGMGTGSVRQVLTILHAPVLTGSSIGEAKSDRNSQFSGLSDMRRVGVPIESDYQYTCIASARAMRLFLHLRQKHCEEVEEIENLKLSIERQSNTKAGLLKQKEAFTSAGHPNGEQTQQLENILEGINNCERVIAHLTVNLVPRTVTHKTTADEFRKAGVQAKARYKRSLEIIQKYGDPFRQINSSSLPVLMTPVCGPNRKRLILDVVARQYAAGGNWGQIMPQRRMMGLTTSHKSASTTRKTLLSSRLSHAATISAHLTFPVYCLRFDRTGRYFVTGADDCLVKLFVLGAGTSKVCSTSKFGVTKLAFNYGANNRGAVLVSTLRGHAGVICDIDVSVDNAFLATASDDGDVRIWGLKDGCPIAILRGHKGGANMVSWSMTTPYRLVSTGMDGLSRIWDVREAALKRYAGQIGCRLDYKSTLRNDETREASDDTRQVAQIGIQDPAVLVPLPGRSINESNQPVDSQNASNVPVLDPAASVALPPGPDIVLLNPAQNPLPANAAQEEDIAESGEPGAFVANDNLDEGVQIIAKHQHGEIADTHAVGPGTRSRRKDVQVICVARCPLGGHFATGSDDGQCRVWLDEDDERLSTIDARFGQTPDEIVDKPSRRLLSADTPSTKNLLATLSGHMNAITDLRYSHAGDRILSASQKDGNARIWSWTTKKPDSAVTSVRGLANLKQIVLKLSKLKAAKEASTAPRRRGMGSANTAGSTITCDVAVWTADDSKVVTSQCCPSKSSGVEIIPGSQAILVWDSWTGTCLMGIENAHLMQCPVIVPHPIDSGIICSAGADGIAKLWDLEAGRCVFTHENKVTSGPVAQNNERGKKSGFLDGSFDHDGLTLILTDDNGRISIFDSLISDDKNPPPVWMREQYFGNDYYELCYDSNGYCIERGSEQPPHLAPRSARSNHSGAAWSDDISETFLHINGPIPILEAETRMKRSLIRSAFTKLPERTQPTKEYEHRTATIMVEFDPSRALVIQGSNGELQTTNPASSDTPSWYSGDSVAQPAMPGGATSNANAIRGQISASSTRSLSSNYRWRDFEDVEREERYNAGADEPDSDDEDFVLNPNRRERGADLDDQDLSGVESMGSDDSGSFEYGGTPGNRRARARSRRRQRREQNRNVHFEQRQPQHQLRAAPARTSARARIRAPEDDSDDDSNTEYVSTNNHPSGPFIHDYTVAGHMFRLPDSGSRIKRKWLSRLESNSSYDGTKNYAPQVGDSVIYIPRAHLETIHCFPTLTAPWRDWPTGARWPTVRCKIKHIRYRFPYESSYRSRNAESKCESIVAILTLEVTGIPELSNDREFPWPKPTFVSRHTRSAAHKFEVSMFESDLQEFIIPEQLFRWRIESLEEAVRENNNNYAGIAVSCYFVPDLPSSEEDAAMVSYGAELVGLSIARDVNGDSNHHLRDSGFQMLEIVWDDGGPAERVSPWEIALRDKIFEVPEPPRLSTHEERVVRAALEKAERTPTVQQFFMSPVNETRYSDYHGRVEVSIDFRFIKQRLASNYYATASSVMSDVQLVRDNCVKYNSENADLSIAIHGIVGSFESDLTTELGPELISLEDDGRSSTLVRVPPSSVSASRRATRSSRSLREARSSLEELPAPPVSEIVAPENRLSSRTIRIRMPNRDELPQLGRLARNQGGGHSPGTRSRTVGRGSVSYLDRGSSEDDEINVTSSTRRSQRPPAMHQLHEEALPTRRSQRSPAMRQLHGEALPTRRSPRSLSDEHLNGGGTRRSSRASSQPRRLYADSETQPAGELEDEDSPVSEDEVVPVSKRAQAESISARAKFSRKEPDDESEDEQESETEDEVVTPRTRAQTVMTFPRGKSLRRNQIDSDSEVDTEEEEEDDDDDDDDDAPKSSARGKSLRQKIATSGNDEKSEDEDGDDSEVDDEESDSDIGTARSKRKSTAKRPLRSTKKRKASTVRAKEPSPKRRSPRGRSSLMNFKENSSEDDNVGESDNEAKVPARATRGRGAPNEAPTKRGKLIAYATTRLVCLLTVTHAPFAKAAPAPKRSPPQKRAKLANTGFPKLNEWPVIDVAHISKVTVGVIAALVSANLTITDYSVSCTLSQFFPLRGPCYRKNSTKWALLLSLSLRRSQRLRRNTT